MCSFNSTTDKTPVKLARLRECSHIQLQQVLETLIPCKHDKWVIRAGWGCILSGILFLLSAVILMWILKGTILSGNLTDLLLSAVVIAGFGVLLIMQQNTKCNEQLKARHKLAKQIVLWQLRKSEYK
jgi:hypothetical protein